MNTNVTAQELTAKYLAACTEWEAADLLVRQAQEAGDWQAERRHGVEADRLEKLCSELYAQLEDKHIEEGEAQHNWEVRNVPYGRL